MILETAALALALIVAVGVWSHYRLARTKAKLAKVDERIGSRLEALEAADVALTSSLALTDGRLDDTVQRMKQQEDKLNRFEADRAFRRS